MSRTDEGRALLRRWESSRPANFYDDDAILRAVLQARLGPARLEALEPALRQAGADSAGPISQACAVLDRSEHLPRLERWNGIGERVEEVAFHPAHHEVGRLVWRSGLLAVLAEPGHMVEHAALTYLFALNGEVPHLCSVACTAGLIKAIQRAGDDRMRQQWLPRLLDPRYDHRWHGAQFLTEVQGGSDVGANACVARPGDAPGVWRLSGEKWFCSNVSADLYAVSARPHGAGAGTAGLGLFVVPRRLHDDRPNGVFIRRLKNKLGTRTLPTAEVDFDNAVAYQLGRLDEGFKLMIGVVVNTSRLEVAIDCAGMMRRAWVEGWRYAHVREAFGRRLVDFPAVREQLAEMRTLATAGLVFTLWTAALEDRLAVAGAAPEDDPLFRAAVNLNKFTCSVDAGLVLHHAIEILGGNGTIEDFSPLPRLYREAPVQESWEGPHNTLMAQMVRDAARAKTHDALLEATREALDGVTATQLRATCDRALCVLDAVSADLGLLLRSEAEVAAVHARRLFGRMARVVQGALLLEQAERSAASPGLGWLGTAATYCVDRWADAGYEPLRDPAYPRRVAEVLDG